MTIKGRYTTVNRLAPGDVFRLGGSPADAGMEWEFLRSFGARIRVRRLHEDRTPLIQEVIPGLMVFVPDYEAELEAAGLGELESEGFESLDEIEQAEEDEATLEEEAE